MIAFVIRRRRRRAFLRAWAHGDLVDAGLLGRSTAS
jgi:hypothetical protein